jgi:hypothetical protein
MNIIVVVFLIINGILVLMVPRRWAALAFLVGACYLNLGYGLELGPLHFPPLRLLIIIGFIRVIMRGEWLSGRMNSLDWLMWVWTVWALVSSLYHKDISATLVNRLGFVFNACGVYFFLRIACQSLEEMVKLCRMTAFLLMPIAIGMLFETVTGRNLFAVLGGVPDTSEMRNSGRYRAQGPFDHSILAGTVGAACLPLMVGLRGHYRKAAIIGIGACVSIVLASASSGPMMSALFAIGALFMWRWRQHMRLIRWLAVLGYIGLDLVMKAPPYYLLARIDLTGSSTGWHRAVLIDTALTHLSEWWFTGTDYTRHWLDYGTTWSPNHIDITNHYLRMGVDGGLPFMLLFIAILAKGFSIVGRTLRQMPHLPAESGFMVWALGASLFTHAATSISVSYFDQSFVFIYLTLAAICSGSAQKAPVFDNEEADPQPRQANIEPEIVCHRWVTSKSRTPAQ